MLGASQLVIDHPGGRFVYTGDYGPGPARTHAVAAPVPCDQLVLESTYALPIFRFPDAALEMTRLVRFCRESLEQGLTPVVLARALGNAQEIIAEFLLAGISSSAASPVYRACEAYEALGVPMGVLDGKVSRLEDGSAPLPGHAVVAPMGRPKAARAVRRSRVALASGSRAHRCRRRSAAGGRGVRPVGPCEPRRAPGARARVGRVPRDDDVGRRSGSR